MATLCNWLVRFSKGDFRIENKTVRWERKKKREKISGSNNNAIEQT